MRKINPKVDNLVWIDLEMTGLDPLSDHIIEIATIITDKELEIIEEGPVLAIYQPDTVLDAMDDWNQKQHGKSGLVDRVRASTVTEGEAEEQTIEFIMHHVPQKKSPMCGNSICQDRRFLARYMAKLEQYFHYRNLDVSTVKVLAKLWAPKVYNLVKKDAKHQALEDIHESIAELRHYRKYFIATVDE